MKKLFWAVSAVLLILVLGCLDGLITSGNDQKNNTNNDAATNNQNNESSGNIPITPEQTAMRAVMMFNLNNEVIFDPLNKCADLIGEKVKFSDEYMQCMQKIAANGFFDEVEKCNLYGNPNGFQNNGEEKSCRIECKKGDNPDPANPQFNNCEKICEDVQIQNPDDLQQKFNGCLEDCKKPDNAGVLPGENQVNECTQKCKEILNNNQLPPEILPCKIKCQESFKEPEQVDTCLKLCFEPQQLPPAGQCEVDCKNKTAGNDADFMGCMDKCNGNVPPDQCAVDCKAKYKDKPEEADKCVKNCDLHPLPLEEAVQNCKNSCDKNIPAEKVDARKICHDKCAIEFEPKYFIQDGIVECKDKCKTEFDGKPLELDRCVRNCTAPQAGDPLKDKCEEFCKNGDVNGNIDLNTCVDKCVKDRGAENPPMDQCKEKCGNLNGQEFEICLKHCNPIAAMPPIDLPVLDDRLKEHKACTEKCNQIANNGDPNNFSDVKACFKDCDDKFLPKVDVNIPAERRDDLFGRCIDKIRVMLNVCKEFAPEIKNNDKFRQCIKDNYGN